MDSKFYAYPKDLFKFTGVKDFDKYFAHELATQFVELSQTHLLSTTRGKSLLVTFSQKHKTLQCWSIKDLSRFFCLL